MSKDLIKEESTNELILGEVNAMEGLEDMDMSSLSIPRIKLLQATSPEVQADEYRDLNLRAGDIIDGLTKEKIGAEIVPVKVLPTSNVLFVPRNEDGVAALRARKPDITDEELKTPGGIICSARDGVNGSLYGSCATCGLCKFIGNSKPVCNRALNLLVLTDLGPMVLPFKDTSMKHGNKLYSILRAKASMGTPMQTLKFKLNPIKKQAGSQQWYELNVLPAGTVDQATYTMARELYNAYKDVSIDTSEPVDTTTSAETNEDKEIL